MTINLGPYLSSRYDAANISNAYRLTSIVSHSGGAESGHYVCFVRQSASSTNSDTRSPHSECKDLYTAEHCDVSNDRWMKFDDERAVEVSFTDVCRECLGGNAHQCNGLSPGAGSRRRFGLGHLERFFSGRSRRLDRSPGTAYLAHYRRYQ